ncbi:hypothetical protein [Couchioplanes caeruleus]|uniref:Uncharacterized protein n=1 Tax=Couchioplanes caeruleus TaxID=56438 RepID=A0A3N1GM74_9ACTN|nr:hypothetical protein [Couchioplanes caeruleus]ROP31362.1 hypothetical protein EDD30_4261 [Couchioplanes caeruleus]
MADSTSPPAAATNRPISDRRFLLYALGACAVALVGAGVVGGAVAFTTSAVLARRSGRGRSLKWSFTVLAALCLIGAFVVFIDGEFGTASLVIQGET